MSKCDNYTSNLGNLSNLFTLTFIVFLVLKLGEVGEVATWSWWWVTAPLWVPTLFIISLVVVVLVFLLIAETIKYLCGVK